MARSNASGEPWTTTSSTAPPSTTSITSPTSCSSTWSTTTTSGLIRPSAAKPPKILPRHSPKQIDQRNSELAQLRANRSNPESRRKTGLLRCLRSSQYRRHSFRRGRLRHLDLRRQDQGRGDREQAETGEHMQHGCEAAPLIKPRHQADRGAGGGETDEIAHRIGARAPFF